MKLKAKIDLFLLIATIALSGMLAFAQEAGQAKVDVNTATQEELAHLPGMTKRKAAKLVAGRPYASADDLSKSGLTGLALMDLTAHPPQWPSTAVRSTTFFWTGVPTPSGGCNSDCARSCFRCT